MSLLVRTWTVRLFIVLVFTSALRCWSSETPNNSPAITNVAVATNGGDEKEPVNYTLTISGRNFGNDGSKIAVRVSPQAEVTTQPVVNGASSDGQTLLASFTAPKGYALDTVSVQVGEHTSDPYVFANTVTPEGAVEGTVRAYSSVLDPKTVADVFGRRIAKKFIVIQLTVTNRSKEHEFLIHDLSIDLSNVKELRFSDRPEDRRDEVSSVELSMLRGVAEKGQVLDPRNMILRFLRSTGTVAAGLMGVAHFGPSYAPGIASFNGPALTAYDSALPDRTINELNRLNDSAYRANTIIPKQQSRVMAVFLPMAMFLGEQDRKKFWDNPRSLSEGLDMRRLNIYVDGNFIMNVADLVPSITTAVIPEEEMKKFREEKAEVSGYVSGNYLSGTDVKLLNTDLRTAAIRLNGTPTDQRLEFLVTTTAQVPSGTMLKIGVTKNGSTKEYGLPITYSPVPPPAETKP